MFVFVFVCVFFFASYRYNKWSFSNFLRLIFRFQNQQTMYFVVDNVSFLLFWHELVSKQCILKICIETKKGKKPNGPTPILYYPWNFDQGFNVFVTYSRMQFRKLTLTLTRTQSKACIRFVCIHSRMHFNDHEIWCHANKSIDLKRIKMKISFFCLLYWVSIQSSTSFYIILLWTCIVLHCIA